MRCTPIRIFGILLLFCFTTITKSYAQTINVDSLILPSQANFESGLLIYLSTPLVTSIGLELGTRNLNNRLIEQGFSEKTSLRTINNVALGYWWKRNKVMVDVAVPHFSELNIQRNVGSNQSSTSQYSTYYYSYQIGFGYQLNKTGTKYNYYVNSSVGNSRSVIDIWDINPQTQIDLNDIRTSTNGNDYPRLFLHNPFVDLSLELTRAYKKRLGIGESLALGIRYGLRENQWKTEYGTLSNNVSDRSILLYIKANFILSINKDPN